MRKLWWIVVTVIVLSAVPPVFAQESIGELLSITVDAGYDGRFRANQWMPLKIELENRGAPVNGSLVVRPETSGNALPNTYSTPVDLPTNSSQSVFLYITARANANILRVELLTENGSVVTSRDVNLRDVFARDQIYVVVSQAATNLVNLSDIAVGGYEAFQANWSIDNVPTLAGALDSVNAMIFSNVDTGTLSAAQQQAVEEWVLRGGHLMVTGGTSWQSTAAGLEGLLPLTPDNSATRDNLGTLANLAGDYDAELTGDVIVTLGDVVEGASVLATTDDGTPLVVRQKMGNGTIDYLTIDPSSQPLRDWAGLQGLWVTLLTSTQARPSWTYGFADWERAATSVEILPGVDLLPAVIALVGFLLAYVLLIGPLNYLVLSRLNKREYAWVTIPIFIVIFSVLAYSVGFEVRGNKATLSRLSVVQIWPDEEEAQLDQLIGLLAPRRDNYTLGMGDSRLLRPISESLSSPSSLAGGSTSTNIRQTNTFEAVEFPVDASFIAAFNTSGMTTSPDIGGRFTLVSDDENLRVQALQGSISNNSEITLFDPVILARGLAYPLNEAFEPGDLRTFNGSELLLPGTSVPVPSSLEYAGGDANPFYITSSMSFNRSRSAYGAQAHNSAIDILGEDNYEQFNFAVSFNDNKSTQELRRRQAFLDAFMIDQFGSTARGNRVYLVGWTNAAPTEEAVVGAGFDVVDTTLYLIEIEVEPEAGNDVLITADQFTWTSQERAGVNDIGPVNMDLPTDAEVIFRFTPVETLTEVDELTIIVERNRNSWPDGFMMLRNWRTGQWEEVNLDPEENAITLRNPARFVGPQNAVEIRMIRSLDIGNYPITLLAVEQRGSF